MLRLVDGGDYTRAQVEAMPLDHLEDVRRKTADLRKLQKRFRDMAPYRDGGAVPEYPIHDLLFQEVDSAAP